MWSGAHALRSIGRTSLNSSLTQVLWQDREDKDIKDSSQQNLLFSEIFVEISSIITEFLQISQM